MFPTVNILVSLDHIPPSSSRKRVLPTLAIKPFASICAMSDIVEYQENIFLCYQCGTFHKIIPVYYLFSDPTHSTFFASLCAMSGQLEVNIFGHVI